MLSILIRTIEITIFYGHSGGHFVQPSRTILAINVKGHKRNTSVKLLGNQAIGRRCLLKVSLFLALAAILFSQAEPFEQFWQRAIGGTLLCKYFEIGPLAKDEMSF